MKKPYTSKIIISRFFTIERIGLDLDRNRPYLHRCLRRRDTLLVIFQIFGRNGDLRIRAERLLQSIRVNKLVVGLWVEVEEGFLVAKMKCKS